MKKILIKKWFVLIVVLFLLSKGLAGQGGVLNKNEFLKRCNYMLDKGGIWEAVNPGYDSLQEWSAKSFGYKFERGYHENFLKILINGIIKGKKYIFWDGYYYWNAVKQRTEYFSTGTGGQIATGEVINQGNDLYFTVINPDGSTTVNLDTDEIIRENEFHSNSYKLEQGEWKPNNKLVWKRIKT